jgi:hypothetical protein
MPWSHRVTTANPPDFWHRSQAKMASKLAKLLIRCATQHQTAVSIEYCVLLYVSLLFAGALLGR